MKHILIYLTIITIIAVIFIGATTAYFSDLEKNTGDIQAGTIDIDIDGNNPWTGTYSMSNVAPGDFKEINFVIHNIGKNPVYIWKIIKNVTTEENGITGPEQKWYNTQNGGNPKNDLDTTIIYKMTVDGKLVISKEAGVTLSQVKDHYMSLAKSNGDALLPPNDSITVDQKYYLKEGTENWAQTDRIGFDIEILAQQVNEPAPSPQLSFSGLSSPLKTVYLNQLGGDIEKQYGYQYDYSSAANNNVYFTYNDPLPTSGKLTGTFHATHLKPYATYQVKLVGIPKCLAPVKGNDLANEYIGYKGRWSCINCSCSGAGCNRTDSDYQNYSPYRGNGSQCLVGYLVFDYFTADSQGNITLSDITISSNTSYHVLFCGGGTCNSNNNSFLYYPDTAYPQIAFCPADKVDGQPQSDRGGCNGLSLDSGTYYLTMSLTEESFHHGNWATVLQSPIDFTIQ